MRSNLHGDCGHECEHECFMFVLPTGCGLAGLDGKNGQRTVRVNKIEKPSLEEEKKTREKQMVRGWPNVSTNV